jgi:phosphate transport system substrate-binding protein
MTLRLFAERLLATAAFLVLPAGMAGADDVTLTLRGDGFAVIGELMASDAASFVIKSPKFGVMAVESSKFECRGAACPKRYVATIGIHGSNTIGAQLMPNAIERFSEDNNYVIEKVVGADPEEVKFRLTDGGGKEVALIDLQSHGSGTAPASLLKGAAQIGAMSRPIKADEVKPIEAAGISLRTHVFALDGVAVFVSPKNPVNALSLEQLAKIFSGEIKTWDQVGGRPGKINLYARDSKSGTYDTFDNLVLKPKTVKISPEAKRFESSPELSDETARDPNGIGFSGFAYIRNAKPLAISSSCGITTAPGVFSVKTEEYPLARRLFLYSSDKIAPVAASLMDYALSDKAQEAISETGFINQAIEFQSFEEQTKRLAPALMVPDKEFNFAYMRDLVNDLRSAKRLSVNFRFQRNSAVLDDKAFQDIPRLARFLKSDAMKPKDILLLGFTDNTGTFDANRLVSNNRATSFKTALVAQGVPANRIAVKAYGNLLPVACNASEAGQAMNRRVEVWVKE